MLKDCLLHWARRHLRWLLCFALLLPVAQLAGAVHAFTHLNPAGQQQRDDGAPADVPCAICVVAAAVGGGAMPSAPVVLLPDLPAPEIASIPLPRPVDAAPQRRLANRGPPSLLS
jgi:hypothetical protein